MSFWEPVGILFGTFGPLMGSLCEVFERLVYRHVFGMILGTYLDVFGTGKSVVSVIQSPKSQYPRNVLQADFGMLLGSVLAPFW